jgi:gas vesicle protein
MATDKSLTVSLFGRDITLSKSLTDAGDSAKTMSSHIESAGKVAAVAFAAAGGAALMMAKAAAEDEQSSTQLSVALKNIVGATDDTVKSVEDFISKATISSGISDDKLRPAFQRLVGSTKDIGKAQELTNLAMEISTAKHLDLETVSSALAKANDGNVLSLKKLGITLGDNAINLIGYNKEQKAVAKYTGEAQIALEQFGEGSKEYQKAMEKVNDHTATANKLAAMGTDVFKELGDTFKGSLSADAETAAGKMVRIQNAMNEAKESIGMAFLPALKSLSDVFAKLAPFISENSDLIGKVMIVVIGLSGAILAVNGAIKAWEAATKAFTVVQTALNVVLNMNPIGLVIIAIVALVAALVLAYQHSETFRNIVKAAFEKVKEVVGDVIDFFKDALELGNKAMKGFQTAAEAVGKFVGSAFKIMAGVIKAEINGVISVVNMAIRALNKIHVSIPDWVPLVGGKSFGIDLDTIPLLAEGGIVNRPTLAMIGEAGPEAVVPLSKMGGMGGGSIVINVAGSVIQEKDLAITVRDSIAQLMRRRGLDPAILGV